MMILESYTMRAPCRFGCGTDAGRMETRNGQDCVFCSKCNRLQYNAPKTETGRAPRTVTTVHNGIKPGQRARILDRDSGHCALCGASGNLHVGHLLSVNDGVRMGMTEADLNHDENLAAMCDECNLGLSDTTVSIRLMVAILRKRMQQ